MTLELEHFFNSKTGAITCSFWALIFVLFTAQLKAQSQQNEVAFLSQESKHIDFLNLANKVDSLTTTAFYIDPKMIDQLINWAHQNGDTNDILLATFARAQYLASRGEMEESIKNLQRLLSSSLLGNSLEFKTKLLLRDSYFSLGAYDKAMLLHSSLDWEFAPEIFETYAPSYFIAFVYFEIENYETAAKLFRVSINQMRQHKMHYWEMSLTNSLGVCFERMELLDSAMFYYEKATNLLQTNYVAGENMNELEYNYIFGLFQGNKGQLLATKGAYLQAIPLLKVDVFASFKDSTGLEQKENGILSLMRLAECYIAINDLDKAASSLKETESIIKRIQNPTLWELLLKTKSNYFEKRGQIDSAYITLIALTNLKDSIDNKAKINRAQNLAITYASLIQDEENEKNLKEIESLKQQAEAQKTRNLIFISIIIFILTISIIAVYRIIRGSRQNREIQDKNREILDQKILIERSLKEKETLLREVNHRVKNNLQIISSLLFFQSKKLNDEASKSALRDSQQRVQTMSLIHQKLYQEDHFETMDFQAHLEDLVRQIISSYKSEHQKIRLSIDTKNISISVDQAVPLSLIIHELVTNSLKHAFKDRAEGEITILLKKQGISAILEYSDDGNGLSTNTASDGNNQIGLKVIQLLAQQLQGELNIVQKSPYSMRIIFNLQ